MGKRAKPPFFCWCGALGVAIRGGQWACLKHLAAPYSLKRRILRQSGPTWERVREGSPDAR